MTASRDVLSAAMPQAAGISNANFLAALFQSLDGNICWITSFRENPADTPPSCWKGQRCLPATAADTPNANSYFSVAAFKRDAMGRTSADFANLVVVVLDDAQDSPLIPTWKLRTSSEKSQLGYRLTEPVADINIAKRLHRALAESGHIPIDHNGNNPVRYVRLPVGVNTKHDPPFTCQLEVFKPELTYSLSELIKGLALDASYILRGEQTQPKQLTTVPRQGDTITKGARNTTLASFAGSMRRRGMSQAGIESALLTENKNRCSPPLPESDVRTIARSISQYPPTNVPNDPTPPIFLGPEHARCIDFHHEPKPHEFIVDGIVPVCNGVLVAPGGVGKTTLTIFEAINIILARDVWHRRVLRPGPVLFITGEDARDDFQSRLYWLADAMNLSATERKQVAQSIFIEDVSTRITRLAELNSAGNIVMTPYVDELCKLYSGEGLAMVNIDPMVYFGAGERLTNDGEAVMCQVAKRLSHELNAHVRLIHHTGKAIARDGIADQYAGRGGSALADGSRQVMQILEGPSKEWPLPTLAAPLVALRYQALRVHFHKVSYAARPPTPIWLLRSRWKFIEFDGAVPDEGLARRTDMRLLYGYLKSKLDDGIHHSRSSLEESCSTIGLSKRRIRELVNESLQTGELVEIELPQDQKRGKLKAYLAPGAIKDGNNDPLFGSASAAD
jgi:hypothetical protein